MFSQNQGLFCFSRCPTKRGGWGCGSCGGHSRGSWPRLATGVLWTTGWVSCSALKAGREKYARAAVAWGLAGYWLAGGEPLNFTSLVLLGFVSLCVFICFVLLKTCMKPMSFLTSARWFSSPIPLWGEWVGGGVVLNHNTHFWHPLWGTDEITGSTRVHWRKFKITISVLQFLVAIFAYLLSTLFYLVHSMLTFLLNTKYESSLKAVLGFFSLLWCVAL